MKFAREIERKYVVSNYGTYKLLRSYVSSLIEVENTESGVSQDVFWAQKDVDFVRLRENTKELTVKITDKQDIVDRVEENLKVKSFDEGLVWATAVFGEPAGSFKKEYTVFYTKDAVVSVYRVLSDGQDRMFLEVESNTLATVNKLSSYLETHLSLDQEYRSLYQIFFGIPLVRKAN